MVVGRFFRVQFDGFGIILERLFYRSIVSVNACQIVVGGRIFGIEGERFLPLLLGTLLIMEVIEKRTVRQQRSHVVRMLLQKILISQADGLEASLDPAVEL